eukprot:CAMPEP_0171259218 /NCGR_PEP_ID=MMETSP0790-20130122/54811_1 /TAXON_ID=2925 /ORGANISM="Alexandrium catenella, Strain OF101" /LENGTH=51 /DNA_ID=CAMNT_0011727479 /DNA_START=15 /DNA_END=167 /DNA_ORIENTATION=-
MPCASAAVVKGKRKASGGSPAPHLGVRRHSLGLRLEEEKPLRAGVQGRAGA